MFHFSVRTYFMRTIIPQILLLLGISSLCGAVAGMVHPPRLKRDVAGAPVAVQQAHRVTLEEVLSWKQPVLWIDARGAYELYEHEHMPGALYLIDEGWEQLLPAVQEAYRPGMRVVVYCDGAGCYASDRVALRLRSELGWSDVYVLDGGWDAWQEHVR
jgi:3-mercaptopyruvate sulfurtransferase SseA